MRCVQPSFLGRSTRKGEDSVSTDCKYYLTIPEYNCKIYYDITVNVIYYVVSIESFSNLLVQ